MEVIFLLCGELYCPETGCFLVWKFCSNTFWILNTDCLLIHSIQEEKSTWC